MASPRNVRRKKMTYRTGRASTYTKAAAARVCAAIASGVPLTVFCEQPGSPSLTAVYGWLLRFAEFDKAYARAREQCAATLAAEIIAIADDGRNDKIMVEDPKTGKVEVRVDYDHIQRSKLRVDARKWYASKLSPKDYGDHIRQEVSGPDGGPVQVEAEITTDPSLELFQQKLREIIAGTDRPDPAGRTAINVRDTD